LATITGSTTRFGRPCSALAATTSMIARWPASPSSPRRPDVRHHGVDLGGDDARRHLWTALTPSVFWAVIAVIAQVP
jgi:hypothetical protein